MSRRAAKHTQADYARALRAAEQATGEKWNPVKRFLQGLPLPSIEKDDSFVL